MKRWDGLVERYYGQQRTRGLAEAKISARERELQRLGLWLKARRPRPSLEGVDAELLTRYVEARSAFHSRSTVASCENSPGSPSRRMTEFTGRGTLRHYSVSYSGAR